MTNEDVKIGLFNTVSLFISFTNIESFLKILLLLVSIVYTGLKVYDMLKKRNDKKL